MTVQQEKFGVTKEGKEVTLYTLTNKRGMKAQVMNYGAILVRLYVPNKKGELADIVTGYDNLEKYFMNGCFFGATIGPSANRIGNAEFTLNGTTYKLPVNDGPNNLHSDIRAGFHKRVWDGAVNGDEVTFTVKMEDGEMGFPGNITASVTYSLTDDDELKLVYHAESDKETVINLTNHTYFNLRGHDAGTILDEKLWINASNYTEVGPGSIPTGKILPVKDTPMDFTTAKRIGDEIDADFLPLKIGGGYDQNWVLDDYDGKIRLIARVDDEVAYRSMEVYTDLPGVQFYAGNSIIPHKGKDDVEYVKRSALCLETQYFPDSANKPEFPSCFFGPDKNYDTTTIYKFIY